MDREALKKELCHLIDKYAEQQRKGRVNEIIMDCMDRLKGLPPILQSPENNETETKNEAPRSQNDLHTAMLAGIYAERERAESTQNEATEEEWTKQTRNDWFKRISGDVKLLVSRITISGSLPKGVWAPGMRKGNSIVWQDEFARKKRNDAQNTAEKLTGVLLEKLQGYERNSKNTGEGAVAADKGERENVQGPEDRDPLSRPPAGPGAWAQPHDCPFLHPGVHQCPLGYCAPTHARDFCPHVSNFTDTLSTCPCPNDPAYLACELCSLSPLAPCPTCGEPGLKGVWHQCPMTAEPEVRLDNNTAGGLACPTP